MSASDRSTNSSKKLISLLLVLLVVVILFITIIGMGSMLYDFSRPDKPAATNVTNNTGIAVDNTHISLDGPLSTSEMTGDITRTSLLRSMKLVLSAEEGGKWLTGNPDWRLFKAQADYVDGSGLAKYWNLVIKSQDSVLLAYVDNGIAHILSIEDNNASDLPPLERQLLLDSNYLVDNVTREKGISCDDSTHFSFVFKDDEAGGAYALAYTDPVNSGQSFTQSYRAKNGEAIEETL